MNIQTKKKVNKAFLYAVQIFVAVVFVIPLVWMIVSSLKPEVDIFKDTLSKMQFLVDYEPDGAVLRFNSLLFEVLFQ